MKTFEELQLSAPLLNALNDLGFEHPTPIQEMSFPVIRSGKNVVGISQTGTGKTLAFTLPLLQDLKYSKEHLPKILIIVPTRELVTQIAEQVDLLSKYLTLKSLAIYGGTNIKTQRKKVLEGADVIVATPGRLYDLIADGTLNLRTVRKVVLDEVDLMLDLGFRFQLTNIFDLLSAKVQNILFSATMTEEVESLIEKFFHAPEKITIALSGTPLEKITQSAYEVPNFYTKVNLLAHLLKDASLYSKVLLFVSGKKNADRIFEKLSEVFEAEIGIIHSNKTQNFRFKAIEQFEEGNSRILLTTDVMARGLDIDEISHVINLDVPVFPENYMHRIGRTARAGKKGDAILFYTPAEEEAKNAVETLMGIEIETLSLAEEVEISKQKVPAERPKDYVYKNPERNAKDPNVGASFHEKKLKNQKTNQGGKYKRELKKKYKKPKTRSGKKR